MKRHEKFGATAVPTTIHEHVSCLSRPRIIDIGMWIDSIRELIPGAARLTFRDIKIYHSMPSRLQLPRARTTVSLPCKYHKQVTHRKTRCTLPDMPMGSPGITGEKTGPFTIYSIDQGEPEIYAVE